MANSHRGEVAAVIGGRPVTLCLTLGALAELEHAFGASDLTALGERFATGRLGARDLMVILGAALRGGGEPISDAEVAALPLAGDGGLAAYGRAVAELLAATFGVAAGEGKAAGPGGEAPAARPFPGGRRWRWGWGGLASRRTPSGA